MVRQAVRGNQRQAQLAKAGVMTDAMQSQLDLATLAQFVRENDPLTKALKLRGQTGLNETPGGGGRSGRFGRDRDAAAPPLPSFLATLTLPDVLPRNTFLRRVDVRECALGDGGTELLLAGLVGNRVVRQLLLDANGIGPRGARALAASLREQRPRMPALRFPSAAEAAAARRTAAAEATASERGASRSNALERLSLAANALGDEGAALLGQALREGNAGLLHLDLRRNGVRDEGAKALLQGAERSRIVELVLGEPGAVDGGASCAVTAPLLALLAGTLRTNQLLFAVRGAGAASGRAQSSGFHGDPGSTHHRVRAIDGGGGKQYRLRGVGMTRLALALGDADCVVSSLGLRACSVSDSGATSLAQGLSAAARSVVSLDLSDNRITHAGAQALTQMLLPKSAKARKQKPGRRLSSAQMALGGVMAGAGEEGGEAGAEERGGGSAAHSGSSTAMPPPVPPTLHTLLLSGNAIGRAGAEHIGTALRANCSLTVLGLARCGVDCFGVLALTAALKRGRNATLTHLDLEDNGIMTRGAEALARVLAGDGDPALSRCALTTLRLGCNLIQGAGVAALWEALEGNFTLTRLDLGGKIWEFVDRAGTELPPGGPGEVEAQGLLDMLQPVLARNGRIAALVPQPPAPHSLILRELQTAEPPGPPEAGSGQAAGAPSGMSRVTLPLLRAVVEAIVCDNVPAAAAAARAAPLEQIAHTAVARAALRGFNTRGFVRLLDCSDCAEGVGDAGATALADALRGNGTLTALELGGCGVGAAGGVALAVALRDTSNRTLTRLGLRCNILLGEEGVVALASAVQGGGCGLESLALQGVGAGDGGAAALGRALLMAPPGGRGARLASLDLRENGLTAACAPELAAGVGNGTGCLRTLLLGGNGLGDEGAAALAAALLGPCCRLSTLDLARNGVAATGTCAFARPLKGNATLKTLALQQNKAGDDGALALAEGLHRNSSLTALKLAGNGIGKRGMSALYDELLGRGAGKANGTLVHLVGVENQARLGEAGPGAGPEDGERAAKALAFRDLTPEG